MTETALPSRPAPMPSLAKLDLAQLPIVSIESLAVTNPVFLVVLGSGARLVLKLEQPMGGTGALPSAMHPGVAHAGSVLMALAVSPEVESIPLSRGETQKVLTFPSVKEAIGGRLSLLEAGKFFLVKMKFLTGINSFAPLMDIPFKPENSAPMLAAAKDLKNNVAAWTSLGKILVVDLLIGNGDRFSFERVDEPKVQNPSNLVFTRDKSGRIDKFVGLDTFDPTARALGRLHGLEIPTEWKTKILPILRDQTGYMRITSLLITDLKERHFGRFCHLTVDLGAPEASAMARGMSQCHAEMARVIPAYLDSGRSLPSGVYERARALGWVH